VNQLSQPQVNTGRPRAGLSHGRLGLAALAAVVVLLGAYEALVGAAAPPVAKLAVHLGVFATALAAVLLAAKARERRRFERLVKELRAASPAPCPPNPPAVPALPTYGSWWDSQAQSAKGAFHVVSHESSDEQFRIEGARIAGAFVALGLCGATSDVLEIGCGVARIGRELAARVRSWTGADISENMLEHARRRTQGMANVTLRALDGVNLSIFEDARFDFAYSTIVFCHLDKEDVYEYMKETFRVLRPGGRAYFDGFNLEADWTLSKWRKDQAAHVGDAKLADRARNQYATPSEVRRFVEAIGFEIDEIREGDLVHAICRRPQRAAPPQRARGDALYIPGHVDVPLENELILRPDMRVEGWALDPAGVEAVEIRVGGAAILAEYGRPRLDIAYHRPDVAGAERCGFALPVERLGLAPGWHVMDVVARGRDGSTFSVGRRAFKLVT
jgi:SAM-dependent methyltransferase